MCVGAAPDLMDLADDAVATVRHDPVPALLIGEARAAELACPVTALRLEEGAEPR